MANRYWVGTGNWDTTNTANWSTSSGGAGGASVPSTTDAVFFDANSGNCTLTATGNCAGINCTGYAGILAGISLLNCFGDFILSAGMTYSRTGATSFGGGSATKTVTLAGKTIAGTFSISSAATLTFTDAFSSTGSLSCTSGTLIFNSTCSCATASFSSTGSCTFNGNVTCSSTFTQSAGTVILNGNLTCTTLTLSGTGVKTFNANAATITLTGTGTVCNYSGSNLTFNRGTSKIALSNTTTTARTFAGGGLTYYDLEIGGATGISTLTITGSNTFNTVSSTKTVAHTLRLTAGTTTTVTNWNVNGTSGNQVTLNSATAGSQATLAKAGGGTVSVNYTTVQDIIGSPTSTWSALTSNGCVDGGNTTGWTFTTTPQPTNPNFFLFF